MGGDEVYGPSIRGEVQYRPAAGLWGIVHHLG